MNHIPRISVKLIDPQNQRFKPECGDWFFDAEDNTITVFVSRMEDWRSELTVALHEIYESVACIAAGVDQTDVDAFDKKFYMEHGEGDAGDSKDAPYYEFHTQATSIEKKACSNLNLDWAQHDKNCK